jgi:hypothetical protein
LQCFGAKPSHRAQNRCARQNVEHARNQHEIAKNAYEQCAVARRAKISELTACTNSKCTTGKRIIADLDRLSAQCDARMSAYRNAVNAFGQAYSAYQAAAIVAREQKERQESDAQGKHEQAAATGNKRIISGDWVSDCRPQAGGVYCERFGGFPQNVYPAGCDGNAAFFCKNIDLCTLATMVYVVDFGNTPRTSSSVANCRGNIRQVPKS